MAKKKAVVPSSSVDKNIAEYPGPVLLQMGRTGLKSNGGIVDEEWHAKLKGQLAAKIYREIGDNDPIVGGALWLMESVCVGRDMTAEPPPGYEDSTAAQWLADWYNGALADMESTFDQVISELMTIPQYGYCPMEVLYKLRKGPLMTDDLLRSKHDDGMWGWRDWSVRAQDTIWRWEIDRGTGNVKGLWQRIDGDQGGLYFIPMSKLMNFKLRSRKKSPEPPGLLRHVYRPYYFCKRAEEMEGVALQRQLAGFLALSLPWQSMHARASADDRRMKDDAEELIEQASLDELAGMVWPGKEDRHGPTGFGAEFMSPTGDLNAADPIIKRRRQDKAIAMLSEMLLFGGEDSGGNRSLGETTVGLLALTLNAILGGVAQVIEGVAIPDLGYLNNFPSELLPHMHHKKVEIPDVAAYAGAINQLASSGGLIVDESVDERSRDILSIKPRRNTQANQLALPLPQPTDGNAR